MVLQDTSIEEFEIQAIPGDVVPEFFRTVTP
jgi:hypothetical protein